MSAVIYQKLVHSWLFGFFKYYVVNATAACKPEQRNAILNIGVIQSHLEVITPVKGARIISSVHNMKSDYSETTNVFGNI